MKCVDCAYYWKDEKEDYARCHFEGPDGWAPCEQDDDIDEPDWRESERWQNMSKYRLIDDALCDINSNIDAYENCEDCPYFWECMEEDDEEEEE